MSDPRGNSLSKHHHLFSLKPLHIGNTEVLISISSIWEDDRIERLENNQCKFLWCNVIFQGINAAKDLYNSILIRSVHIERCFGSIDKDHLSRYKEIQIIKAAKKGLIDDYSQNMISSFSLLQDKSSEDVELYIQRISRLCTHQISLQHQIHLP